MYYLEANNGTIKAAPSKDLFHYIKLTPAGIQIYKAVLVITVLVFPEAQLAMWYVCYVFHMHTQLGCTRITLHLLSE